MTTITPGRVYHAGHQSPYGDIRKQELARQTALERRDFDEADRCDDRKQAALDRLTRLNRLGQQKSAIQSAMKPGKRDPLATFPPRLRAAADALRDSEESNTLRLGPGFSSDYVEGGMSVGMEVMLDRRRKTRKAWQHAFSALATHDQDQAIYNIIVSRCSIASQLKTKTSSAERRALSEALWTVLAAAADHYALEAR